MLLFMSPKELTLMLRHQQAYSAATRLVRVADEMAQALLTTTLSQRTRKSNTTALRITA